MIRKWRFASHSTITINRHLKLDTLFSTDNHFILANSEDKLQCSEDNLQNKTHDFNIEICIVKSKRIAFQRKDAILSKICIYNKVIKKVNCFKYRKWKRKRHYWKNYKLQQSNRNDKPIVEIQFGSETQELDLEQCRLN